MSGLPLNQKLKEDRAIWNGSGSLMTFLCPASHAAEAMGYEKEAHLDGIVKATAPLIRSANLGGSTGTLHTFRP
jgi:hypothetical protein